MLNALCFFLVVKCVPGASRVVFMQGVLNNALFRGRFEYGSFVVVVVKLSLSSPLLSYNIAGELSTR